MGKEKKPLDLLNIRARDIFKKSEAKSEEISSIAKDVTQRYCSENNIPLDQICFIAIGSVGRKEALEASDLDIIPILKGNGGALINTFQKHDKNIRELLATSLDMHVSKGEDLTKFESLDNLTNKDSIGGDADCSASLTKRILILSESKQVGGELEISKVREEILQAYGAKERTSGRHVLSLCNDIARYYKTLCIEYKAKVDNEDKDWCTRNIKLRHSRKLWYFSTMISIIYISTLHPNGDKEYISKLLNAFKIPPHKRLLEFIPETQEHSARNILEKYSWFMEFMSKQGHRTKLSKIEHKDRYNPVIENPFPLMKLNSDMMHHEMVDVIENLPSHLRHKVYDWFLL